MGFLLVWTWDLHQVLAGLLLQDLVVLPVDPNLQCGHQLNPFRHQLQRIRSLLRVLVGTTWPQLGRALFLLTQSVPAQQGIHLDLKGLCRHREAPRASPPDSGVPRSVHRLDLEERTVVVMHNLLI